MPGPGIELIGAEETAEVMEVLQSGYLSRYGPSDDPKFKAKVHHVEEAIAKLTGVKHGLALHGGGSAALWITLLSLGFAPALLFYLSYNALRFGSPLESGYGMASLPAFLEALRQQVQSLTEMVKSLQQQVKDQQATMEKINGTAPALPEKTERETAIASPAASPAASVRHLTRFPFSPLSLVPPPRATGERERSIASDRIFDELTLDGMVPL